MMDRSYHNKQEEQMSQTQILDLLQIAIVKLQPTAYNSRQAGYIRHATIGSPLWRNKLRSLPIPQITPPVQPTLISARSCHRCLPPHTTKSCPP